MLCEAGGVEVVAQLGVAFCYHGELVQRAGGQFGRRGRRRVDVVRVGFVAGRGRERRARRHGVVGVAGPGVAAEVDGMLLDHGPHTDHYGDAAVQDDTVFCNDTR